MKHKLLLIFAIFISLVLSLSNPPKAYASGCTLWGGKTNFNVGDLITFFGTIELSYVSQEYHITAISQNGSRTQIGDSFFPDITFFLKSQQIPSMTTGTYTIAFEQKFGGDISICGNVTINGSSAPPSKVPPPPPPSKVPPPPPPPPVFPPPPPPPPPPPVSCPFGFEWCNLTPTGNPGCMQIGTNCGFPPPPPPVVPPPPPPPGPPPPPADLIPGAPTISLPGPPAGSRFTASAGLPAQIISGFIGPIIVILGFLTVFYIIFAGIRFIISRGDPEKVAEARHRLIYAVVGFIILLLALVALQIVEKYFLGSKVA